MNLQTVINNLRNTIADKERLYQSYCSDKDYASMAEVFVINAKLEFIQINIDELKRILQDVEQCVAKDVEQSWRDNPDRMGGQFTEDEIDNHGRWI